MAKKILVIDDSALMRRVISDIINSMKPDYIAGLCLRFPEVFLHVPEKSYPESAYPALSHPVSTIASHS